MLRIIDGYDYIPVGSGNVGGLLAARDLPWYLRNNGAFPGIEPTAVAGLLNGFGTAIYVDYAQNLNRTYLVKPHGASPPPVTGVVGVGVSIGTSHGGTFEIAFFDASNNAAQFTVAFCQYGIIKVYTGEANGGVLLLTTGAGTYQSGTRMYVEVDGTVDPAAGIIKVYINTVLTVDITAANTQGSSIATFDSIGLGSWTTFGTNQYTIDDVYFLDKTGAVNNDRLGNVRVWTQFPNGAGASTDFTPVGAATNWQAASNLNLDDTIYDVDGTVGDFDLYAMQPIVNAPACFGVQVSTGLRQDDATQITARNVLKSGATTVTGVDHATSQTYAYYSDLWELDPNTGVGWTGTGVNGIEVGPKVEAIA